MKLIDVNSFWTPGENASNLRIDTAKCQYDYNLGTSTLGRGIYQVEVRINNYLVGGALFTLE